MLRTFGTCGLLKSQNHIGMRVGSAGGFKRVKCFSPAVPITLRNCWSNGSRTISCKAKQPAGVTQDTPTIEGGSLRAPVLSNISVVLVSPQTPGNIGAVARLADNFEMRDLWVVNPRCDPHSSDAQRVACGSSMLDSMHVVSDLSDALADTVGSIAFSRRTGVVRPTHASLSAFLQRYPAYIPPIADTSPQAIAVACGTESMLGNECPLGSSVGQTAAPAGNASLDSLPSASVPDQPPMASAASGSTAVGHSVGSGAAALPSSAAPAYHTTCTPPDASSRRVGSLATSSLSAAADGPASGVSMQAAPADAWEDLSGGRVALVFGREEAGLTDAETALCAHICGIPSGRDNPSLNLSHAVCVVLSQLFERQAAARFGHVMHSNSEGLVIGSDIVGGMPGKRGKPARSNEVDALVARWGQLSQLVGWGGHEYLPTKNHGMKRKSAGHMRAILFRAQATVQEVRTLHGVCKSLLDRLTQHVKEP